jgi:uncharacterized membrane protein
MHLLVSCLLWFSAIGCGLMAGVYFAFSTFVMMALGRIDQASGIAAMNAINTDILKSLFMPLFFATSLASAALTILSFLHWGQAGATPMLIGGLIYIAGMFIVTVVFNVPLNEALGAAAPTPPESNSLWQRYLSEWTMWNHVRTIASTLASAFFIAALTAWKT